MSAKGTKLSAESKAKISASQKARYEKIKAAMAAYEHAEETRETLWKEVKDWFKQ